MLIVSVCPNLRSNSGHDSGYAKAVTQALQTISWPHLVLIPANCEFQHTPDNWRPALPLRKARTALGRIKYWSVLARSVRLTLARLRAQDPSVDIALFLESFTIGQLGSVVLALLAGTAPVDLCLLYRNNADLRQPFGFVHRCIIGLVRLGTRCRVTLLSDSRLIADTVRGTIGTIAFTLPIPHTTSFHSRSDPALHDGEIKCWWPGSPRPEKGLEKIKALLDLCTQTTAIRLMVSQRAGLRSERTGQIRITELPDPLSESDYVSVMERSDIILLPYDTAVYSQATSGIFVEAVWAGKIPLVTARTWMANELCRFGLERLIVDWTRADLLDEIASIHTERVTLDRLAEMRREYVEYHNPRAYGRAFQEILMQRRTNV